MERLFIYGSLQPGGPNEQVLTTIGGDWEAAVIRGRLIERGWGASIGYPGLAVDDAGAEIQGYVFSSHNLRDHWGYLDSFEGGEYERIVASVTLRSGSRVEAHVYVLREA